MTKLLELLMTFIEMNLMKAVILIKMEAENIKMASATYGLYTSTW
jgi:hypothetical protein